MTRIRLQWRLRTLMILVAVVALSMSGSQLRLRADDFRRRADQHAAQQRQVELEAVPHARIAAMARSILAPDGRSTIDGPAARALGLKMENFDFDYIKMLSMCMGRAYDVKSVEDVREVIGKAEGRVEERRALAAYHAGLRRKYEDAARHPWRPVAPDPPPPSDA
ncbi:MAG TPA: hypothetical protein VG406_27115 [Isosphaeraceae bacterium]|jgi:hypothetical protein|nr:hypothetical protein [Isosphaeraceae bacterium]